MHLEILTANQKRVLSKLGFTKDLKLYLAGGTALALQIGHRTSVDFDFYTNKHFTKGSLIEAFKNNLKGFTLKVLRDVDDTFEITLNNALLSCFYYPYPLVGKTVFENDVSIASIEDIAAMKLVAISQRGKRRDFIDMYYLIKIFGLAKIFALTGKKYKEFDKYNGLRGLLYFMDADNDKDIARIRTFQNTSWPAVKKFISEEVRSLTKREEKQQ